MLLVDSREPKDLRAALIATLGASEILVRALHSADFVVLDERGTAVGIERKTISDFLSSLASPRLQRQTGNMDTTYPIRILLLEGRFGLDAATGNIEIESDWGWRATGWHHASFLMALLSLQHRHGFYVIPTGDQAGTVDALRILHTHIRSRTMKARDDTPLVSA